MNESICSHCVTYLWDADWGVESLFHEKDFRFGGHQFRFEINQFPYQVKLPSLTIVHKPKQRLVIL